MHSLSLVVCFTQKVLQCILTFSWLQYNSGNVGVKLHVSVRDCEDLFLGRMEVYNNIQDKRNINTSCIYKQCTSVYYFKDPQHLSSFTYESEVGFERYIVLVYL